MRKEIDKIFKQLKDERKKENPSIYELTVLNRRLDHYLHLANCRK